MFARVALDFFSDKEFDYRIPVGLAGQITPGSRVEVPFGKSRRVGTVLDLSEHSPVGEHKIKEIFAIASGVPRLSKTLMDLLHWVHRYYGGSMGKVIRSAVPAAVRLSKVKEANTEWVELAVAASSVYASDVPATAGATVPRMRSPKDVFLLSHLAEKAGRVLLEELLQNNMTNRQVVRRLEKKGLIRVLREHKVRGMDSGAPIVFHAPKPVLSDEQRGIVESLLQRLEEGFRCELLYGVTGSGKTEVYLRVIERALEMGRTALVLVPEISLTPQTIDRFRSRFDQPMAILHSALSEGERFDQWRFIERGGAKIVIGARSAVFAPLQNLGVIIVDEEQERSFKQQEAPHYHARDVAVMRAKLENALVILSSATPSLESYHNAVSGKYGLLELHSRVDKRTMPKIEITDMRLEHSKSGAIPILSGRLTALLQARLDSKEQSMLFLNRRGYHRCLWCPTCAQALQCPHCSITLTVHRVGSKLMCHLCGHTREVLSHCPTCAADLLIPQGHGTQKIEGIVRKCFPKARVARMDADTTRGKLSHRDILSRFALGHYDILIGTQMIAKGHDFPNVTLVGILNADMGMNVPDFRAAEQTFHLLTQVAGRAGRGAVGGEVIVQTHVPGHFVLAAVKDGNYRKWYDKEIALRRELHYPPQAHLILVGARHPSEAQAQQTIRLLHRACADHIKEVAAVLPPAVAPIQKTKGQHRWQMLLKTHSVIKTQEKLQGLLAAIKLPSGVTVDIDADPQVLA